MTNQQVVQAWKDGKRASTAHLRSDGNNLYSYAMLIGITLGKDKVTFSKVRVSHTTNHHVNLAKRVATLIEPENSVHNYGFMFPEGMMNLKS